MSKPRQPRRWCLHNRKKPGIGAKIVRERPPTPEKNRWRTEKMSCKTMKQDDNDQNHKKESTPVVDKRPNGKSQMSKLTILLVINFLGWAAVLTMSSFSASIADI